METAEAQQVQSIKQQVFGAAPISSPAVAETPATPEASANGTQNNPNPDTAAPDAAQILKSDTPSPTPAFDHTSFLKDNFGYEKAEDIKSQLARISELEQKANTPAEYQYASDQAKALAYAINSGNFAPIKEFVDTQMMLSNTEGMNEEQQLKLLIKMRNPLFSDKLVDEEYNDQYVLNEEDVDESRLERERLKLAQKRIDDARQAQTTFSERKAKISLPNIPTQTADDDPAYVAWKASQDKIEAQRKENDAAYAQITAKDLANSFQFNDEANKMKFDVSFEPDAQSLSEIVSTITDEDKFTAMFAGQDGSPDRNKFAKVIYDGLNIQKIVNASIVEAVNKTKLWFLANQKNIGDNIVRNYNVPEQSDVDRLRQQVYSK